MVTMGVYSMPLSQGSVLVLVLFAVTSYIFFIASSGNKSDKNSKKLLKLPIIGDLHDSPIEKPLLRWDSWCKKNGPVATAKLFGIVPIVIINTAEAATELLGRRSTWYSNRPSSVSMEMMTDSAPGKSKFTLMHDYDDNLKLHHRILSPSLGPVAAPRYQPIMEVESRHLARDLLNLAGEKNGVVTSDEIYPYLERTQASNILTLHHGIRIPSVEDPLLHEIVGIHKKISHAAANPQLPDFIPVLRHLPALVSPWKRAADAFFAQMTEFNMRLLKIGDENPGWNATKETRAAAAKYAKEPIPELDLAFALATSVQGGMDTSPRALLWLFVAAVAVRGDFMTRAHALIDDVVGRDRLPRFSDRASLVYIDAIVSEIMRWRPISPGSIPRRADKNDDFEGTPIAKNATLFANAWSIGRDPAAFSPELGDLDEFIPERWFQGTGAGTEGADQSEINAALPLPLFGQGRRSCLGKRVALDGSFMQVATMLWAFDFEMVEEIDDMEMVVTGFMTVPKPFSIRLKPRGPWVAQVIERDWATAEQSLGDS